MGFCSASALFLLRRKPRLALTAGILAVVCWGWWQEGRAVADPGKPRPETFRVAFWNTARLNAGWPKVAERIREMQSPVMGFVEAGPDKPADRNLWREEFPNHDCVFFGNEMVLLIEGKVIRTEQGPLADRCYYGLAAVEIAGKPLTVILVDLFSNPFYSREKAFLTLSELIEDHQEGPLLVLGDFNTPADSVHTTRLRSRLENALERTGPGPAETWPATFPVLSIDQIWVNGFVDVHQTRVAWSLESDHRAVLADLALSE